jgi:phosphoglycolate phosphatase
LLDFDGPVCSMFAGYPAPQITDELRSLAVEHVGRPLPELADASGPHELLAGAGAVSPDLPKVIEEALQLAEIRAAESAMPTPGAQEFRAACRDTGRPVAVVSNNCLPAVVAYLERGHGATRRGTRPGSDEAEPVPGRTRRPRHRCAAG